METRELDYIILTATEGEQTFLRDAIGKPERALVAHREIVFGRIFDKCVALVATGIGMVNTAQALTGMLESSRADRVIQIGIGGAYPSSGLKVGDIAVASEEIAAEYGVETDEGFLGGEVIGIPLIETDPPTYNRIPLNAALTEQTLKTARLLADKADCAASSGPFVTVQTVTGSAAQALVLDKRFGALCENMEGAATAQVCSIYDVPMAEIRGISNIVEKRDLSRWKILLAAKRAQEVTLELISAA